MGRTRHLGWMALLSVGLLGTGGVASDASAEQAAGGDALIYIYRRDAEPVAERVPVGIDARRLGELATGSHLQVNVPPGPHTVRAGDRAVTTLHIDARPNATYYVWLQALPGVRPLATELTLVNEASGRAALAASRAIGVEIAPVPAATPRAAAPPPAQPAAAQAREVRSEPPSAPASTRRGALAVILKGGSFTLDEPRQVIDGVSTQYDEKSSSAFSGAIEYRDRSGLAVGGELLYFNHQLAPVGTTLESDQMTLALLFNAKYYLGIAEVVYPYIGAGFGSAATSFDGYITGNTAGLAGQLMAGIELRLGSVGIYGEYKKLSSTTEDSSGQEVDVSGSGVFVGLSVSF